MRLPWNPARPPGAHRFAPRTAPGYCTRDRFEDAVLGFVLLGERPGADGKPERFYATTWVVKASFPVFMLNVLGYLGGGRSANEGESLRPGQQIELESPQPGKTLVVVIAIRGRNELKKSVHGKISFTDTGDLGLYEVQSAGETIQHFAVNLFDISESNIRPREEIKIGRVPVAVAAGPEPVRREAWKLLLWAGLAVLLFEWYIYNRRVYL